MANRCDVGAGHLRVNLAISRVNLAIFQRLWPYWNEGRKYAFVQIHNTDLDYLTFNQLNNQILSAFIAVCDGNSFVRVLFDV